MLPDQGLDQVLGRRRLNKIFEWFVIPLDSVDVVYVELDCVYVSLTESV